MTQLDLFLGDLPLGVYPTQVVVDGRRRSWERFDLSHLVSEPGDSRVRCGSRADDVPTTWIRWMGDAEVRHIQAGNRPPSWCNWCILGIKR